MYNTMYGGIGAVGNVPAHGANTTQNAPTQAGAKTNNNPIHIKIEDQTGLPSQPGNVGNELGIEVHSFLFRPPVSHSVAQSLTHSITH